MLDSLKRKTEYREGIKIGAWQGREGKEGRTVVAVRVSEAKRVRERGPRQG